MAAARRKVSTRSAASRKGWKTRREREAREAAAHERRVEAARKGYQRRLARERAASALDTFLNAVDSKASGPAIARVKESWHRTKRDLHDALDGDYERYLEVLEALADAAGTSWQIAY